MDTTVGARSTFVERDVRATTASLNGFLVAELAFPAEHAHRVDPERGYVGVIVEGTLEKTFARQTRELSVGSAFTMPPGAAHATRVGPHPTTVIVLHPAPTEGPALPWPALLGEFSEARDATVGTALRLAAELRAQDEAWSLAAEGLCLELVARLLRGRPAREARRRPWLEPVRERLHASDGDRPSLTELADAAGVHPVYLARTFREQYGVSIGEYARQLRLDWSATQLTATETPLAVVAAEAGFADQSHFTRAFKRHTGLTPARYRAVRR